MSAEDKYFDASEEMSCAEGLVQPPIKYPRMEEDPSHFDDNSKEVPVETNDSKNDMEDCAQQQLTEQIDLKGQDDCETAQFHDALMHQDDDEADVGDGAGDLFFDLTPEVTPGQFTDEDRPHQNSLPESDADDQGDEMETGADEADDEADDDGDDEDDDDDDDEDDDEEEEEPRRSTSSVRATVLDVDDDVIRARDEDLTEEQYSDQLSKALELKESANVLYKNQYYLAAIDQYTEARNICPFSAESDRAVLYSNRAAAKVAMADYEDALTDCNKALELNPTYVRALLRRSAVYEKLDRYEDATKDMERVLGLDPGNTQAVTALQKLPDLIKLRDDRLKTELMGKLKDLGNLILRPFGMSTDNFQLQQDPNTGSYSVNMKK